jgi:O-antigen ligase
MRMETLATYAQDQSAIHRLEIWKVGFDYALEHPFTGAGFEGWRWIYPHADHPLDWHSAYVQIMAEHGLIAFGIWMLLFVGTLLSLSRLAWQAARLPGCAWVTNYATMLRTSLMAYGVGSLFLNTAYWDLLYQLMIIAVLLTREAHAAFTAGEFSPSAHR